MKLKTLLEATRSLDDAIKTRLTAVRAALAGLKRGIALPSSGDDEFYELYDTADDRLKIVVYHTLDEIEVSLALADRGAWRSLGDLVGTPEYEQIMDRYDLGGSSALYAGDGVSEADVEKFAKKLASALGSKKVREAADPYADVDKRNPAIPDAFEVKVGGKTFHVSMSPWMWMRPSQARDKMGFSVALKPNAANAEAHFFHDVPAAKGYLGAKKADVAKVVTDWLKAGGAEALEKKAGDWAKVRADFKKAQAGEDAINAKDDAEAKAAGATHRVDAWVHPRRGGRDRQVSWYTEGTPSHDGIKAKLRGMGSMDAGDYKVVAL